MMKCDPKTFWTLEQLAKSLNGRWVQHPPDAKQIASGVSIDTRTIQPSEVFFAIRGDQHDGHDYIAAALHHGASVAIVASHEMEKIDPQLSQKLTGGVLAVEDPLEALQSLASQWREQLRHKPCQVIGVGGSNGKTTTRNIIHHLLTAGGLVGTQSPKSFNNHIGVPLTLLAAKAEHDFVVVEIGTNHPGEIDALAELVKPNIAIITSIGQEHLEFFNGLEAVAHEESQLLAYLEPKGLAVIPASHLWPIEPALPSLPTHCTLEDFDRHPLAEYVALPGAHNQRNASAAIHVAQHFGINNEVIQTALQSLEPVAMRSQILTLGHEENGVTLINDAYNANPSSMSAALHLLKQTPGKRHVAILGDMFELGSWSPDMHRKLGRELAALSPEGKDMLAVLIGTMSLFAAETLLKAWPTNHVHAFAEMDDEMPKKISMLLQPGDTILIKASRGMKLERLVPAIEARFAG